ncbi:GtrA family protein [bacterium C-53]|nr:GtrA family protein [Lachnospiraceae bacterium]NBI02680.1 GtrA family protein [Lachnospiraceae bacterium]RKJ11318.1 GtrA family protein [bacterium C-53]
MQWLRRLYKDSLIKFIFIGMLNTLIGTSVMFLCYRLLGLGCWLSSAMNYIVGSIFSYFANKYFTFQSKGKSPTEIIKFLLNIFICYIIAYGCAKPAVKIVMSYFKPLGNNALNEIAMIIGMILFVFLNYFGQKFFVFIKK